MACRRLGLRRIDDVERGREAEPLERGFEMMMRGDDDASAIGPISFARATAAVAPRSATPSVRTSSATHDELAFDAIDVRKGSDGVPVAHDVIDAESLRGRAIRLLEAQAMSAEHLDFGPNPERLGVDQAHPCRRRSCDA